MYFLAQRSSTPLDPDVMQATLIWWPSSCKVLSVPPIEITSSSGCGENMSTFYDLVAFLGIDAISTYSESKGRPPSGHPVMRLIIFLQTQRLRSSTQPLAHSMIRSAKLYSSQSSQVSLRRGLLILSESQATLLTTQYLDLGTIGSSMSPFIVQGVLNLVSNSPAALSMKRVTSLWPYRKVDGTLIDGSPSRVLFTIYPLASDHAITMIFFAFLMVEMPMVSAHLGTLSYPPKQLAVSFLVILLRQTRRVMLLTGEGGSLKPMWPVLPTPRIWMSMPPQNLIFFSQSSQNLVTWWRWSSPSGMLIFSGGMSMCLKRLWCMQQWQELKSPAFMGQYSSKLKVTTFLKLSSPFLYMRISYRYIPRGLLPVASPRTQVLPWLFLL